jgi:outer membrane protein TolC
MKSKNSFLSLLAMLFFQFSLSAQTTIIDKLSYNDFLNIVKENHPIAKQASLLLKNAEANKLSAKGNFDPKIYYDFQNKYFNSKNYYQLSNGGFHIPTWYGVDFKLGKENNFGQNINPQNSTPNNGLLYTQISVPVFQGLLIDERRAALKKAALFETMSSFEKTNAINELISYAGKSYWDWQLSYVNLQVIQNAIKIAQQRFEAVKRTTELGDRPIVDTIESFIQLQERVMSLQEAQLDYNNKSLSLSNFLWLTDNTPIELTDKIIPAIYPTSLENDNTKYLSENNLDSIIELHPEMKLYQLKLKQFEIDKQLKADKLKPVFNLNYNPLAELAKSNWLSVNNYKWGFTVGFPLFLRKERGELKMAKIKIDNTISQNANKRNSIKNLIKSKQNEVITLKKQYDLYFKTVNNYEQLWLAEKNFLMQEKALCL